MTMLHLITFFFVVIVNIALADPLRHLAALPHRHGRDSFAERHTTDNAITTDYGNQRFSSDLTAPYFVHSLPEFNFSMGELYSGVIPIDRQDSSRQLFFVFKPATEAPVDEVTIWLSGGPGCSSLYAFLLENGPAVWAPGAFAPTINPHAWSGVTNVLWIDQPVGTGFSTGEIRATSEEDIAADFVSWFRNWQQTFGIQNFKTYLTGESYAGRYIPYIAAAMLDQNDTACFNVSGALLYDPTIGNIYNQFAVPIYSVVEAYNNILNPNESTMQDLATQHEKCGYANWTDTYLQFPPTGIQPSGTFDTVDQVECDIQKTAGLAAQDMNPCFDIYEITRQCPIPENVISFPVFEDAGTWTTYFNRSDVKRALHAPTEKDWIACALNDVFVSTTGSRPQENESPGENDVSLDPTQHVLPQVIEATDRVLISSGDLDLLLPTNGTLLAIQNMTWNGKLGLQKAPSTPIVGRYEPGLAEVRTGTQHFERGLMWAETFRCGHMQPMFQPAVAYRHLLWMLGRIETL